MVQILIADDHKMFREGLKQILTDAPDIIVADEASNSREVLEKVEKNEYDVLILDISIPEINGLEILRRVKNSKPHLNVLILSMYSEDQYAVRAIKAGASGYLTKNADPDEFIEATRKIAKGEKYITPAVADQLAIALENKMRAPSHHELSDREYQVLCMLASGKTISTIADELELSTHTIGTIRSRVMKKMKMKNNAELTYYAIKEGLIS
ncbi:MAG: response regulator [Calditrichia bacterium]